MSYSIYMDEKGPQETFKDSNFQWDDKLNYGSDKMHDYVGVALCFNNKYVNKISREFEDIEKTYKETPKVEVGGELKGSKILKGNFKYGIASMYNESLEYYLSVLDLLMKYNVKPFLFQENKMSVVTSAKFRNWILDVAEKEDFPKAYFLKYSLTKYLEIESNQSVLDCVLDSSLSVQDSLSVLEESLIKFVNNPINNNPRMEAQRENYKQLIRIIKRYKGLNSSIYRKPTFDWNKIAFKYDLWLINTGLKNGRASLHLDEGIPKEPFRNLEFSSIESGGNSAEEPLLRICDVMAVICGKLIQSLSENALYDPSEPAKRKTIDEEFFNLTIPNYKLNSKITSESKYKLACDLYKYLFHNVHYGVSIDVYFDNFILFKTFLAQIHSYSSFKEYKFAYKNSLIPEATLNRFISNAQYCTEQYFANESETIRCYSSLREAIDKGMVMDI
ncbi:hypothetical protein [Limosilactobacillus frumenti]|nr:hypothetical protein [Limosilactobacillus frumenti]QFG72650.1 hypothetical protein LF145_04540 [Limosilactobacillus frumenti]